MNIFNNMAAWKLFDRIVKFVLDIVWNATIQVQIVVNASIRMLSICHAIDAFHVAMII